MLLIPIVFVDGVPCSGKGELIDALANDLINGTNTTKLVEHVFSDYASCTRTLYVSPGKEYFNWVIKRDVKRFIPHKVIISKKKLKQIFKLYDNKYITNDSLEDIIIEHLMEQVRKVVSKIRTDVTVPDDVAHIILMETNPIYLKGRKTFDVDNKPSSSLPYYYINNKVVHEFNSLGLFNVVTIVTNVMHLDKEKFDSVQTKSKLDVDTFKKMCNAIEALYDNVYYSYGSKLYKGDDTVEILSEDVDDLPKMIHFVDGLIGAGKSTSLHMLKCSYTSILEEDLPAFKHLLEAKLPNGVSRRIKEEGIFNINIANLKKLINDVKDKEYNNIYVERNLFYSDWIFSAVANPDGSYPIPSIPPNVESELLQLNVPIGYTYAIETSMQRSYKQMIDRGHAHDEKWTKEELKCIADKYAILYYQPFQYKYASVRSGCELDNLIGHISYDNDCIAHADMQQ